MDHWTFLYMIKYLKIKIFSGELKSDYYLVQYFDWNLEYNKDESVAYFNIIMEKGDQIILGELFKKNIIQKIYILIELCECVKFLHDKEIAHLDLKLDNFIKIQDKYKLIDFDTSLSKKDKLDKFETIYYGTPDYMNAELSKTRDYTFIPDTLLNHDIFSLGTIILMIIFDKTNPWDINNNKKVKSQIVIEQQLY